MYFLLFTKSLYFGKPPLGGLEGGGQEFAFLGRGNVQTVYKALLGVVDENYKVVFELGEGGSCQKT